MTINDNVYKISQYADDTHLLLDGSENSLRETKNHSDFNWY